jgi:hypothetical protein
MPQSSEFTIEPIHVAERRKRKWFAQVSVTDTGRRLFVTPFCGSPQSAAAKAREMIAEAIEKNQGRLVEVAR